MTMTTAPGGAVREETLQEIIDREVPPDLRFPRLNRVVAMAPVSVNEEIGAIANALGERIVQWAANRPHPLVPNGLTVVRMYRRPDGIKIYSISNDGKMGVMNFVPIDQVRITEAVMESPVLLDELAACEAGEDDSEDDDPEGDDPEPPPAAAATAPVNGQSAS